MTKTPYPTAQDLLNIGLKMATEELQRHDEVQSRIYIATKEGRTHALDLSGREASVELIKLASKSLVNRLVNENNFSGCLMVGAMWYRHVSAEEMAQAKAEKKAPTLPSESPDKKEALFLFAIDGELKRASRAFDIERYEDGTYQHMTLNPDVQSLEFESWLDAALVTPEKILASNKKDA